MSAELMLKQMRWYVVGSHGRNPIAARLVNKLQTEGKKTVFKVSPYAAKSDSDLYVNLAACPEKADVVNLVINPAKGLDFVKEMAELKIKYLWIQPGAESPDILSFCRDNGIAVHQGCVLVEGKW